MENLDPPFFASVDEVAQGLRRHNYIVSPATAMSVFLSERLAKPLLIEGPAGCGKTELAKALAATMNTDLYRLQCYEGLDESKALYEWAYPKQLLYTQLLREKIGELVSGAASLKEAVALVANHEDAFFSERFLLQRPLLKALRAPKRVVLLIDEVDRAEAEFEAFLLEVLSDFQVSIPELGPLVARHIPLVVLTSNSTREMTDALKRRCLYLNMDFPDAEQEAQIVKTRLPDIQDELVKQVVAVVQALRTLDLKKKPSVAETLEWTRALTVLGQKRLDARLAEETLNLLLKYQGDLDTAREQKKTLFPNPQ